jgi:8-oxo-dGTP pyrophosphatase MutT (NUDIX family)
MKSCSLPRPEDLQKVLASTAPLINRKPGNLQAAVLVMIYPEGGDFFIPLTVRANDLPVHAGQISLPGGRVHDTDDNLKLTALRETHEEIGVRLELSHVLGCLPVMTTNSGYEVTPVVAWAQSTPQFQLNRREVDELIPLPLRLALNVSQYSRDSVTEKGLTREFYVIEFCGHRIWGATAHILRSLACLLQ